MSERPGSAKRLRSFHELMQHRVRRILLVSSLYDSFIMSEEGHLQESLLNQFLSLNLSSFPDLVQVATVAEALHALDDPRGYDLVVASLTIGEEDAGVLAGRMRADGITTPVLALAYTGRELRDFLERHDTSEIERIFLWQGDVRILLAMVVSLEDRLNVAVDTSISGVPVIIVVEDNIRYYSSFLPVIYTEIHRNTERLLSEGLNPSQKMIRMRARPKVLLCTTYEEAVEVFDRYEEEVLGIVSDFEFPRQGELDQHAGLRLCRHALEVRPDIRVIMQSSVEANRAAAAEIGASFLRKGSPVLLQQLRTVLVERMGFGDFVFRIPGGTVIDRAKDLREFEAKLRTIEPASLAYHASRNHFSNWMKARTEFTLAEKLRPRRLEDYDDLEDLRRELVEAIEDSRARRNRTVIADFDRKHFDSTVTFTRIGGGSLGGKARGVAFANRLLEDAGTDAEFPDVRIYVPPSVVLGTEVFEQFLESPDLHDYVIADHPDEAIVQRFLEAPFPRQHVANILAFLQEVRYPLAVRSSSLLEDSLSQPFAGVYRTFMLPNNHLDVEMRWQQLAAAIKRVYASVFVRRAKSYMEMTSYRLEEERMGAMIQALVGRPRGDVFYPEYSGVARSHNFYPEPGTSPEDGVAAVALGMGRTVVSGGPCLRFSPRHPRQPIGFATVKDALSGSQREFWALDASRELEEPGLARMVQLPLQAAEGEHGDGPLAWLGSTYLREDDRIVDGISRAGVRLISFAQVLKHRAFPLAEIIDALLGICSRAMGGPVEIEFAGNLASGDEPASFAFLQMRPLAVTKESEAVEIGEVADEELVCRSAKVLGNGRIDGLRDIVFLSPRNFDRSRTGEAALEVSRFDAELRKLGHPYLLVGVGRWGSADPALGIPVQWHQIAGARVIVEAGFEDLHVEPSQGTHFFQNLTSCNVGYFTVNPGAEGGWVDWDWLNALGSKAEGGLVRHVRLERPLEVQMNGRSGAGVVRKPRS